MITNLTNGGKKAQAKTRKVLIISQRFLSKDSRIGIVGGGPGGLSTAYYLQKKGYKNIKVFEKASKLGGKAYTLNIKDSTTGQVKNYELGAEFITYAYNNLWSIIKELNIQTSESSLIRVISKTQPGKYIDPVHLEPFYKLLPASLKYLYYGFKYRKQIASNTNLGIYKIPFLSQSVESLVNSLKLQSLAGMFIVDQFGYGTFKTFPTIHLYRTVSPIMLLRILADKIPIVRSLIKRPIAAIAVDGTQDIYMKMGEYLNNKALNNERVVYTDSGVTNIKKYETGKWTLTTDSDDIHEFDTIIFGIPGDNLKEIIDDSNKNEFDKAINLFSKFRYHPYYVDCFENLSDTKLNMYYYQNLNPKKGEIVQLNKRYDTGSILARGYNFETYDEIASENKEKRDKINEEFRKFMKDRLLVNEVKLLQDTITLWPTYHPHVTLDEFQKGFFDEAEKLQGNNNLYFVGDAMTMENMELTIKYSIHAVNTYF